MPKPSSVKDIRSDTKSSIMPKPSSVKDSRSELVEIVRRRVDTSESLAALERQVYAFEGSFLGDNHFFGNTINGLDHSGHPRIRETDRHFSRSSVTSRPIVTGLLEDDVDDEDDVNDEEDNDGRRHEKEKRKLNTRIFGRIIQKNGLASTKQASNKNKKNKNS